MVKFKTLQEICRYKNKTACTANGGNCEKENCIFRSKNINANYARYVCNSDKLNLLLKQMKENFGKAEIRKRSSYVEGYSILAWSIEFSIKELEKMKGVAHE